MKTVYFNSHTREGVTVLAVSFSFSSSFQLTHPWGCDFPTLIRSCMISISTHTPVRVWRKQTISKTKFLKFQLTHPWGCDTRQPVAECAVKDFNSHTREGVTNSWSNHLLFCKFQLTHPWGCDTERYIICRRSGFQLTHPWGCDSTSHPQQSILPISTHTPVRVWLTISNYAGIDTISTHTPVRVWLLDQITSNDLIISTHTPVRVWLQERTRHSRQRHFNSHTREGVTSVSHLSSARLNFNSHTREGVTQLLFFISIRHYAFQLTHPWGCDCVFWSIISSIFYFNSHTREGVTSRTEYLKNALDFNSHTREGVTKIVMMQQQWWLFQLTHPWGCDSKFRWFVWETNNFNSHTREGVTPNVGRPSICL